ncbi:MAG: NADH-quinone oxidoreductase subunit A [Verrucomicrobia bacterium]|nr:NADH-quinone oxidoreductase subunit A [Verrucomicrobiota bacterium]
MNEYLPIALLVVVAILFAASTLIVSAITSQKAKANSAKDGAYECGLPPMSEARPRFSVKFYMVAMLFILFDIEVVFLYPWAVVYKEMIRDSAAIFWSMFAFLGIIFLGFLYSVRKGALDWK